MACSRSENGASASVRGRGSASAIWRNVLVTALIAVLVSCAFLPAARAYAASSLEEREVEQVQVLSACARALACERTASADGTQALAVTRISPMLLSVSCEPASIDAGVDCGMVDMCGIYPCLCGSADAWGGCSCNGLAAEEPQLTFTSSDESVVRVVNAFGRTWLVPVHAGTATLSVTATLEYYDDATAEFTLDVGGLCAADGLFALAAVLALALCALIVFALVRLVGAVRRHLHRRRRARAQAGDGAQGGEEA